jgi:uncharacterized lipoprotein YddW (UPF0748 family)
MDPSSSFARERALSVMLDVVGRYDVDGIHIDDYFYPYPDVDRQGRATPEFPDGKTPAARRAATDGFVREMYRKVKEKKPWVRVGISPFGIWRPGVPEGTTASIDAYHHLAADSRKWLQEGWCDYLSPQLYWRIEGPQSFTRLLSWWRAQGTRPVWPGIAASRIDSTEDPGRPASEILNQVAQSRQVGRNYVGHVFWSAKSLRQNRGGVSDQLVKKFYGQPALVPPMPWVSQKRPTTPAVRAVGSKGNLAMAWNAVPGCRKYAIQVRVGRNWRLSAVTSDTKITLQGLPDAVAVSAVDRYGNTSNPRVLSKE